MIMRNQSFKHLAALSVLFNLRVSLVLLAVALTGRAAWGADILTTWTGANGNWTDPTWDNGNPANGYQAFINNGGTVTLNTPGNSIGRFYLGCASDYTTAGSGSMVMNGGDLTMYGNAQYVGYKGSGTFTLNSGTLTAMDGCEIEVGAWGGTGTAYQYGGTINNEDAAGGGFSGDAAFYIGPYGNGTYNLVGGTLNSPWTVVGYGGNPGWGAGPGTGTFVQSGAVHNAPALTVGGGWDNGGNGTYTLSGTGSLNVNDLYIAVMDWGRGAGGDPLVGTFNQNGGTVTVSHELRIGSDATTYADAGIGAIGSGGRGNGTYNFNGGTLSGSGSMVVRYDTAATGTFQGKGTVGLTGNLINNGRIIADGGTLDLSSFSAVANTVANTTDNGWFARNAGQLVLPAISVTGSGLYTWGADPSLVNSVKLNLTGVSGPGSLTGSLLDPANALVPSTADLLGLGQVVGLWDFNTTFGFSGLDATFNYDNVLADGKENSLELYEYEGGTWVEVPTILDTPDHLAYAGDLSSVGFFAAVVPEPTTIVLFIVGLLSFLGFRRAR